MMKSFIFECFIITLHSPPGLNYIFRLVQSSVFVIEVKEGVPEGVHLDLALDSVLSILMCFRVYLV